MRARSDGTLGPQLRPSTVNCDAYRAEVQAAIQAGTHKVVTHRRSRTRTRGSGTGATPTAPRQQARPEPEMKVCSSTNTATAGVPTGGALATAAIWSDIELRGVVPVPAAESWTSVNEVVDPGLKLLGPHLEGGRLPAASRRIERPHLAPEGAVGMAEPVADVHVEDDLVIHVAGEGSGVRLRSLPPQLTRLAPR